MDCEAGRVHIKISKIAPYLSRRRYTGVVPFSPHYESVPLEIERTNAVTKSAKVRRKCGEGGIGGREKETRKEIETQKDTETRRDTERHEDTEKDSVNECEVKFSKVYPQSRSASLIYIDMSERRGKIGGIARETRVQEGTCS